jgi:hypothetical protein
MVEAFDEDAGRHTQLALSRSPTTLATEVLAGVASQRLAAGTRRVAAFDGM